MSESLANTVLYVILAIFKFKPSTKNFVIRGTNIKTAANFKTS